MDIAWTIDASDINAVKAIVETYRDHAMVRNRFERNLADQRPSVSRASFWRAVVAALLTTQQRSGPTSAVARFISLQPFPFAYASTCQQGNTQIFFRDALSSFGGIRRHTKIADELSKNLRKLQDGLWPDILKGIEQLRTSCSRDIENVVADFIDDELVGFGPKQARNLLQGLGLTRYEIPIDSRITKWLNGIGFPVHLSSTGLADRDYYKFVMDGVFELCRASDVYPCVFDAAVFSSFDGDGWTDENVGW